jgi:uncharacterized membrane protein
MLFVRGTWILLLWAAGNLFGDSLIPPLTTKQAEQTRKLLADFKHGHNRHSHVWLRWFNELPVLILAGVVLLAVLKPF